MYIMTPGGGGKFGPPPPAGKLFSKICLTFFWKKNPVAQWKICQIGFAISFLEPGGNSEQSGDVQTFVYINSNCVF